MATPPSHAQIYGCAHYYDLAFGYRDIDAECAFLREVFRRHGRGELGAFLELAAGPARHAIAMAASCGYGAALDLSPEMVAYGRMLAAREGVAFDYHLGNMVDFSIGRSVDLVATLLDSASYLLTNDEVYAHFAAVARCLRPGGLYVLELQHPTETFGVERRSPPAWEIEHAGERVRVEWGHVGDPFDPITQQTVVSTKLIITAADGAQRCIEATARQRCFGANELRALVTATPELELVALFGALDVDVPFDARERARYMVPVLRRR